MLLVMVCEYGLTSAVLGVRKELDRNFGERMSDSTDRTPALDSEKFLENSVFGEHLHLLKVCEFSCKPKSSEPKLRP